MPTPDPNELHALLARLPQPEVPAGLKQRVLNAVHASQQSPASGEIWRQRIIKVSNLTALGAVIFWGYQLFSQNSSTLLITLIRNPDALSSLGVDLAFALADILPLGGLLVALTALCIRTFMLAIRFESIAYKSQLNFS